MQTQSIKAICTQGSFGDKRLNFRFEKILHTLAEQVECSIPQAFKQWGQTKAVYRFLSNNKVTGEKILSAQLNDWTEKQLLECSIVLAIHDTTELDFTGNRSQAQLGCLSYEHQRGLFLHNTLLCNDLGIPQTIFHQHYWSRDMISLGQKKSRKQRTIEEKESIRWIKSIERVQQHFNARKTSPQTTVIDICDREGDIYELLALTRSAHSHYIIRSCNNRKVKDDEEKLWEQVKKELPKGCYTLELKDKQTLQKRVATIEVKWLENIILSAPYRKSLQLEPISVNMIYVEEVNASQGNTPINWKLLTSMKIQSVASALKIITYYSYRWRIETFHYILKQGCKVEQLQLEQEHNLKNAISLYSLMANRLLAMMYLSREKPQSNIDILGFTPIQFALMCSYLERNYQIKINQNVKESPTLENFTQLVGILGGYQKHNSNHPGIKVLWRGMKELFTLLNCIDLMPEIRCG